MYFETTTSASPLVVDISVDKGTTGAPSLPWAGANTRVDIQFFFFLFFFLYKHIYTLYSQYKNKKY